MIAEKALYPNPATSIPLSPCHPPLKTTPQVFLFSVLRWAVTPQLLSLYCFSLPRSLHKTLKELLKRELRLQLSIQMIEQLNVTVTFMYALCNLPGHNSRLPCSSVCSRAQVWNCNQRRINQREETAPAEKWRQSILSSLTWTNTRYCYMLFILRGAFELIPQLENRGWFFT